MGIIAPHTCYGCGAEGAVLCGKCLEKLPAAASCCYRCYSATENFATCAQCRKHSALRALWAVTPLDGAARQTLHALKYARARAAARDIAAAMAAQLHDNTNQWVVVPVPTASSRVRQRGYDQARLIARDVAVRLHCPVRQVLVRQHATRQVGSTRAQRQQHMRQAFRLARGSVVKNANVLLVDDVVTTGATMEAAARMVRMAGAREVRAAVFARAE